ncbi:MAG: hypothetical protein KDA28_12615, partial [Phycisphaerales bacterium]|nr:hypothetical protein [Phycisphaerales bacterium]
MADSEVTTEASELDATTPSGDPIDVLRTGWRTNWQAPSLLLSLALLGSGVVSAILSAPSVDLEPTIDRAARLVEQESFEDAIDLLNSKVFPYLDKPELRPDQRRRFHQLIARSIYYGQRARGEDYPQNHENVISQLLEAERIDSVLTPRDVQILADTYLSIGRVEKALERVATIPDHERERRYAIYKRLIEDGLRVRKPDFPAVISYIETLLADPAYPQADRLWALARQAE